MKNKLLFFQLFPLQYTCSSSSRHVQTISVRPFELYCCPGCAVPLMISFLIWFILCHCKGEPQPFQLCHFQFCLLYPPPNYTVLYQKCIFFSAVSCKDINHLQKCEGYITQLVSLLLKIFPLTFADTHLSLDFLPLYHLEAIHSTSHHHPCCPHTCLVPVKE